MRGGVFPFMPRHGCVRELRSVQRRAAAGNGPAGNLKLKLVRIAAGIEPQSRRFVICSARDERGHRHRNKAKHL